MNNIQENKNTQLDLFLSAKINNSFSSEQGVTGSLDIL